MAFEINKVSVKKNDYTILNTINFLNQNSENYLILGESGAGKSTFLDLIASKIFPSQGKINFDKTKKIALVSRDYAFHKIVGSAYQYYQQRYNAYDSEVGPTVYEIFQNQVLPIGTVDLESVDLPPLAYSESWLQEVAETFKIKHLLERKVTSLSNGETRKTLLAYWFLKKPDVLLLDNPFSGLDAKSREDLKNIISNLKETQIFLVADLQNRPKNFEHVIRFENGEIVFEGNYLNTKPYSKNYSLANVAALSSFHEKEHKAFEIAIKLVNAQVNYGEKIVLDAINWEVKAGECWAVLGPNGSGKSTLMSLLTGDNPQCYKNEIYLFDKKRGTGESIWDIKQRTGFVSPELHLYFHKQTPVWKVVGSGFFDSMGLFRKLNETQLLLIEKYLEAFGLNSLYEKRLDQLSTGQQRMILLIRALVKNPQVLILDEPCQGLDYNQMVFFREALNELVLKQNKTLIYITHYEDEIPACVNRRLYLDEGKVVKVI